MGSKNRIAKHILPIMLSERKPNQYYVEPFAGGLGTFDKVKGLRIGADKNEYLIAMWNGLQNGRTYPTEISRELYSRARDEYNANTTIEFDDFMIGWIGYMGSFNGRFFDGGYSGTTTTRNYIDEQIRNTAKQIPTLNGAVFVHGDYRSLQIPSESIIYCDIPYKGTKQYSTSKDFDYEIFWQWAKEKSEDGHTVFVSEYEAPSFAECVWSGELTSFMKPSRAEKKIEKLFKL